MATNANQAPIISDLRLVRASYKEGLITRSAWLTSVREALVEAQNDDEEFEALCEFLGIDEERAERIINGK